MRDERDKCSEVLHCPAGYTIVYENKCKLVYSLVGQPAPSQELCTAILCCGVSSGQVVQDVTTNLMLIVVNYDIYLHYFGWTIRHAPYNAMLYACNTDSMRARHNVHLCASVSQWLTHQENCGVLLTKPHCEVDQTFLSCEVAATARQASVD